MEASSFVRLPQALKVILVFGITLQNVAQAKNDEVPIIVKDEKLSRTLEEIVAQLGLSGDFPTEDGPEQISLAIVDLTKKPFRLGGVNEKNFIYPASVYKMYVAAEVLNQVEQGKAKLDTTFPVEPHNVVDSVKEVPSDPRPLLAAGDQVTVGYLLDLMVTRSDNSAANCMIDFAQRPNINKMIERYGWKGSEVTRKFLKRTAEDPEYRDATSTMTCGLHTAEFLTRIHTRQLLSPWVSMQMESLLGRQLDNSKLARGLPSGAMYYHKTGWYAEWSHDVGIVDDGNTQFIVACFLPLPESTGNDKLKALGSEIYDLMTMSNP